MYKKRKKTRTKKEPIKDLVNLVKRQRLLMTDWNRSSFRRGSLLLYRVHILCAVVVVGGGGGRASAMCHSEKRRWKKKKKAPMVRLTAPITREQHSSSSFSTKMYKK